MTSSQINELESFFPNKNITKKKITRLTAPGENYGSLMLQVDMTLENEDLYLVAKAVPPNEITRQHFNTENTFRAEIAFYKKIVPLLQHFQKEYGVSEIDFFPKYYGSRLNLRNDDSEVDTDGVLLLENVKQAKYLNLERTEGFGLDVAQLVVSTLAQFHAVPLALRLKKKDIFDQNVRPHLQPWRIHKDFHYKTKKLIERTIDTLPDIAFLKDRILAAFDRKLVPFEAREPFVTVVHNDFWINNVMIKFENGKPVHCKMVDFQEYIFASPAVDLIFFLYSSVKEEILEKCYEDLVKLYYDNFVSTLKKLDCDVSKFSFEALKNELAYEACNSQLAHLLFMFYPIYAPRESANEEATPDDLLEIEPSDLHLKRFVFVVKEFARKNWI